MASHEAQSFFGVAVRDVGRLREVAGTVVSHGFGEFVLKMPFARQLLGAELTKRSVAVDGTPSQRFAQLLAALGPTYTKLGQLLSMRSDLLPAETITALTTLQDRAPEVPFDAVVRTIETGLGRPVNELFEELERAPLATASIGQTHRARTRDGLEVVVKVQRPDIGPMMRGDLDLLWLAAKGIEASVDEAALLQPAAIVAEFEKALLRELNFASELANLVSMERLLRREGSAIRVPRPLPELSCNTVLTMEYATGRPVRDLEPGSPRAIRVASALIGAMCQGVFVDGFFHGDPHAGNILVDDDERITLLDLGLVGNLSPEQRDDLVTLVLGALLDDSATVARVLLKVGSARHRVDIGALKSDIARLRAEFITVRSIAKLDSQRFIEELLGAARRHSIRLASEYSVLAKSAGTMEGLVRRLAPDLDVVPIVRPYVERAFEGRWEPDQLVTSALGGATGLASLARTLPTHLDQILHDLETGNIQVRPVSPELEKLPALLHDSATRIGVAIFAAAMSIAAAVSVPDAATTTMDRVRVALFGLFASFAMGGWAVMWFWHWLGRGVNLPLGSLLRLVRRR